MSFESSNIQPSQRAETHVSMAQFSERSPQNLADVPAKYGRVNHDSALPQLMIVEHQADPNAKYAQLLLADNGAFFNQLDTVIGGGQPDGRISRNDLVRFNENVETNPDVAALFSREQIEAAKQLEQHWDDQQGGRIHTHSIFKEYITRETLTQGAGLDNATPPAVWIPGGVALRAPSSSDALPPYTVPGTEAMAEQDPNEQRARTLLANGGRLFNTLDTMHHRDSADGKIDRNDLVAFIEQMKRNPGWGGFTQEEYKTVIELEKHWEDDTKRIRSADGISFGSISRETLAHGLGLSDRFPVNAPERNSNALIPPSDDRCIRPEQQLVQKLFQDGQQRYGEGPYQVAERLLPGATHKQQLELAHLLKHDYQQRSGDHSDRMIHMRVGEQLLNPENLARILAASPNLRQRLNSLTIENFDGDSI